MTTSSLHHLALTSAHFEQAKRFYGELLPLLGYESHIEDSDFAAWTGPDPEILLYTAKKEQATRTHATYDPGIHHLAFRAPSREVVDAAFALAVKHGASILEEPRKFTQYRPDYYATFFLDLDGVKLEFVHLTA
jgi:glyoxylase I family protein